MSFPKTDTPKDPGDVSDFPFDFSGCIPPGDTITSIAAVTIEPANQSTPPDSTAPDVALSAQLYSGQLVTLWLQGGKPKWRYLVTVQVMTAGGRTFVRRFYLPVDQQ